MRILNARIDLEVKKIRFRKIYCYRQPTDYDHQTHITEAAQWLCRAQDAGLDDGVAYGTDFGKGFLASYPETTGYIICTFLKLADYFQDDEYFKRAKRMGDWEIDILLDSGAVMGGMADSEKITPAVFNTGQVLLGWNFLYIKDHEKKYYDAAEKAAGWLLEMQDENGGWSRGNSLFSRPDATTYNARVAWALCQFGVISGENKYIKAGIKNAEYSMNHQIDNGWFRDCCLLNPEHPLLHTIAYTMRGLLEAGIICRRDEFIESADRSAQSLVNMIREDGYLPGKIDSEFHAAADYACLAGIAQLSIVLSKLYRIKKEEIYKLSAKRLNEYLMRHHDISSTDDSIRGGLAGSWPVSGEYGRFRILNWATKFLIDALLEEPS